MTYLLLIPTLLLAALFWWTLRRSDEERKRWEGERLSLLREHYRALEAAEKERSSLLNRIQAPEVEVAKQWDVEEPAHLPWDDDEAFNKHQAEMN